MIEFISSKSRPCLSIEVIEKETSLEVRSKVFEEFCRDLKIVNGKRKIYKLAKK